MRIGYLFRLSGLILWRSWRATLVLSFMILSAVAALVFLSALAVGSNDAMIRNSTGLYSGHIAGSGISESDVRRLHVPGVKQILVRQQLPVLLRAGKGIEPVALTGVNPAQERQAAAYWKKTVRGSYLDDDKNGDDESIFISEEILRRLEADLGDDISMMDRQGNYLKRLKVGGVYKTGITYLDHGIAFVSARTLPPGDAKLSVAVFLEAKASPEAVAGQLRNALPSGTFFTWSEFMPDLRQLIDLSNFCMAIFIFVVFAIVAVGISSTFLIFTLKNLREHGIMKAMGFLPRDTALLLLIQIGLLTVAAAAIGTIIGAATAGIFSNIGIDISTYISHNQYFAVSGILYPRLTWPALLAPPMVALAFSLMAAAWPVAFVLRRNPADILRSV